MRTAVVAAIIALSAIAGAFVGFALTVLISCYWLWPGSNLCGILGPFVGAPVGLVVGGLAAAAFIWKTGRGKRLRGFPVEPNAACELPEDRRETPT